MHSLTVVIAHSPFSLWPTIGWGAPWSWWTVEVAGVRVMHRQCINNDWHYYFRPMLVQLLSCSNQLPPVQGRRQVESFVWVNPVCELGSLIYLYWFTELGHGLMHQLCQKQYQDRVESNRQVILFRRVLRWIKGFVPMTRLQTLIVCWLIFLVKIVTVRTPAEK